MSNQRVKIIPKLGELKRNYKPSNATVKNRGHDITVSTLYQTSLLSYMRIQKFKTPASWLITMSNKIKHIARKIHNICCLFMNRFNGWVMQDQSKSMEQSISLNNCTGTHLLNIPSMAEGLFL